MYVPQTLCPGTNCVDGGRKIELQSGRRCWRCDVTSIMAWTSERRLDDLFVKHKHGDTEHDTDLKTDAHGFRQAQCRDCEASLTIDRDMEERARAASGGT